MGIEGVEGYGKGWGHGGEMTQALYAHVNNKTIKKNRTKMNFLFICT
jgi:hypothetical protein